MRPTPEDHDKATEALAGPDRIETAGKAAQTALGAATGAALAGTVAHAAGASTVLGSSALASMLGGAVVATTPIGWVIGATVVGGALAYGLSNVVANGGRNTERRRHLERGIREARSQAARARAAKQTAANVRASGETDLRALLQAAVDANLIDSARKARWLAWVADGTLTLEVALERTRGLLSEAGIRVGSASDDRVDEDEPAKTRTDVTEQPISPASQADILLERIRILQAATSSLAAPDIKEGLADIARRLTIARILAGEAVIAIAGTQGAGKTTLAKMLYELDDTWLRGNEGRGERSPVLIVEDPGVSEPVGRVLKAELDGDEWVEREIDVTPEEFNAALGDRFPGLLMPKLHVPPKHFGGQRCGFMLLPGFEKKNHANRKWQSMMRQALLGADICVIVTDETRLANRDQQAIVDALRRQIEGAVPVVAIAKTEGASAQRRAELIERAAEVFGIPSQERDRRIVCTGADRAASADWIGPLIESVQELPLVSEQHTGRHLALAREMVDRDLTEVLSRTESEIQRLSVDAHVRIDPSEAILQTFDKGLERLRRDYFAELDKTLKSYREASLKRALGALVAYEEGPLNQPGKAWRWLRTTSGEREQILPDYVKEAWADPFQFDQDADETFADAHARALAKVTSTPLHPLRNQNRTGQRPQQIEDLEELFDTTGTARSRNPKDLVGAVSLLPAITLEFARIAALDPEVVGRNPRELLFSAQPVEDSDEEKSIFKGQGALILSVILASVGGTLSGNSAIEGAREATGQAAADAVGQPADYEALKTALSSLGASIPMLASAASYIGAAVLLVNFIKSIQRAERDERNAVRRMTAQIADVHDAHFKSAFDHLMDRMRERLEDALRRRYGRDDRTIRLDRLRKALTDVQRAADDFREALDRDPAYALG